MDYRRIAEHYDETRIPLIQDVLAHRLSNIIDMGRITGSSVVLDIGCGTGIYTILLAKMTNASVFGLDSSRDMVRKARTKADSQRVEWLVGAAEHLPLTEDCFDCVFMTMVIHQIADGHKAVDGMYRVLNKDGTLVIMTKSHGQIKRSLMMDFPKTREIDLKRFPSIPALRNELSSAGFKDIRAHIFPRGFARVPTQDYLERIGKKCISTLALLSEEDFRRGQKIFEKRVRERWGKEVVYEREDTVVIGER